ncbi:Low conductance mechanosensitive channel YnaI [Polaribacter huanghezhanensis]|uniref:mechanosensitive ion channel family protein n=1 Tax=Polaribacter huanghezhanensis TaxID=1354726 RepID=UPI0026485189|nr:mechanosensitive ion channel family protein [Polaribacter huanghezhanensis]WKD84973.1 Low conductance mechanosensitive channel YnaI [Polaribacter huanghezhanensis]
MKKLLLVFLLFTAIVSAQDSIKVNLKNPNATVYTHLYFLQSDSYQPEKAAQTIFPNSTKKPKIAAIRLKQILDGKGLFVDFKQIPTDANYKDSLAYGNSHKYVLFPNVMPLISVEKIGDNWYYSQETMSNLDEIYNDIFPWYVSELENLMPNFGHKKVFDIEVWKFIGLLLMLLIAFLVHVIFKRIIYFTLHKIHNYFLRKDSLAIAKVLKKLAHPISLLIALSFVDKIYPSLQFGLTINKWMFIGLNITQTVFWIYVFLKLVTVTMEVYSEITAKTENKLDDQLIPVLNNLLKGIVIFVGILKMLTVLGINTTAVIAGASIGGLAVALASQDTVKNLIGTFMIFLDKPFYIGDWIEAGGVEGSVEEVGFRSSRIRAADTSIFQIPNSKLSEIVINNKGLRLYRRYNTNVGIRYDTPPELIEAFVKGVREIIIAHPETRSEPDSYNVEFTGFGDSSLLILINVYFKSLAWGVEQSSRHKLHIAIVKLAKALGIDFAFPSSTVMIEQFPEKQSLDLKYNIDQKRIDEVIKNQLEEFHKK